MFKELDKWIKIYTKELVHVRSDDIKLLKKNMIDEFKALRAKYSSKIESDATFKALSEKLNNLRKEMKEIQEKLDTEMEKIIYEFKKFFK